MSGPEGPAGDGSSDARSRPFVSIERKHLLIAGAVGVPVVFLIGACACCGMLGLFKGNSSSGPDSVRSAPKTEVIRISAPELFDQYEANDIAADKKYKGKILEVSGVIDSISRDILDNIYVTFKSGGQFQILSVQCFFDDDQEDKAAELRPGQFVKVRGRCDGKFGNVGIKDCVFVD